MKKLLGSVIDNNELFNIVHKNESFIEFLPEVESLGFDKNGLYNSENLHDEFQKKIAPFTFSKPFICQLDNVELVGASALLFYKKRPVLENSIGRYDCFEKSVLQAADCYYLGAPGSSQKKNIFSPDIVICNLVNVWSKGYFHWILEGLTRLEMVRQYEHQKSTRVKLLIDQNPTGYIKESLLLLGFEESDLVYYTHQRNFAKKIILPSFRRQCGYTSTHACKWLREKIFSSLNINTAQQPGGLRIYISRELATKRKVINEDELTDFLLGNGFIKVNLEEYSFTEQVQLFSKASFIVAPHGAGITNIIFSRPGSIILELFHENYVNPCYFTLAMALGLTYYYSTGKEINDNMAVEMDSVKSVFSEIFAGQSIDEPQADI
ncbi:MAG: glycosyltransferase family 61 protein [Bacteroidota bacterium]|nr:glycosyltransferase family 61 protein [Bacteroidota bacterium]